MSPVGAPGTEGPGGGGQRGSVLASARSAGARSPGRGSLHREPEQSPAPAIHACSLSLPRSPAPASRLLGPLGRLLRNRLPLRRVFPRPRHRAIRHHRWPGAAPAAAAGQAQRRAGRGEPLRGLPAQPSRLALLPPGFHVPSQAPQVSLWRLAPLPSAAYPFSQTVSWLLLGCHPCTGPCVSPGLDV